MLGQLREHRPVTRLRYPDGHVGWLVTNYRIGRAVLTDPRFSMLPARFPVGDPKKDMALFEARIEEDPTFPTVVRDKFRRYKQEGQPLAAVLEDPEVVQALRQSPPSSFVLQFLDDPEHRRLRGVLAGHFGLRRVNERRGLVERIVEGQLDELAESGPPADLMELFALPVASLSICGLFGVPGSSREKFERAQSLRQDPSAHADSVISARLELVDFVRGVIQAKRSAPGDDMLSELAQDPDLSDDDLAGIAIQLFAAGHHATAHMLGLATLVLLHHEQYWDAVRKDPAIIADMVEELLRYVTLIQVGSFSRTALVDVDLDGTTVKAGESVTVSLAAANRDPQRFPQPDKIDFGRDTRGHLAFGYGRHMCIGQHLARLELQVAISGLVRRYPSLRLAVPLESVKLYGGDRQSYGVERLAVSW